MSGAPGDALEWAVALLRSPGERHVLRQSPLPPGVERLLAIAARVEPGETTAETVRILGEPIERLREAAQFYAREVLFHPQADAYRALGVSPDASSEQIKTHHRLLQLWLHPDRQRSEDDSIFASRVNIAWNRVRNDERRRKYDEERAGDEQQEPDFLVAATPRLAPAWRSQPPPDRVVRPWQHRLPVIALFGVCLMLGWLALRNNERAPDAWSLEEGEPAMGRFVAHPGERSAIADPESETTRAASRSSPLQRADGVVTRSAKIAADKVAAAKIAAAKIAAAKVAADKVAADKIAAAKIAAAKVAAAKVAAARVAAAKIAADRGAAAKVATDKVAAAKVAAAKGAAAKVAADRGAAAKVAAAKVAAAKVAAAKVAAAKIAADKIAADKVAVANAAAAKVAAAKVAAEKAAAAKVAAAKVVADKAAAAKVAAAKVAADKAAAAKVATSKAAPPQPVAPASAASLSSSASAGAEPSVARIQQARGVGTAFLQYMATMKRSPPPIWNNPVIMSSADGLRQQLHQLGRARLAAPDWRIGTNTAVLTSSYQVDGVAGAGGRGTLKADLVWREDRWLVIGLSVERAR